MKRILFEDALLLRAVKALRVLVRVLPLPVSFFLARRLGDAVFLFSKRRWVAYRNLRAAFAGEKSRAELLTIARRSVQNIALSAVELLRAPEMDMDYVRKHVTVVGAERFEEARRPGKGVIFLTAHFGNWEMLNLVGSLMGHPMVALARVQKHPRSDAYLNSLRTSHGAQVIWKGIAVRQILRALKEAKIVGIIGDQDGGRRGVFVPFFGRLSSTPPGAAKFSARTGAPIFPIFIFREAGGRHRIEVEKPLEAGTEEEVLRQFAAVLEEKIRRSPEQWLWAHRRWKSTPDRSVLILSDGKAGHLNQSLAVLEAVRESARRGEVPGQVRSAVVEPRFRSRWHRVCLQALSFLFGERLPAKPWLLRAVLDAPSYDQILRTYADVVVSCGASLLGLNLLVKAENRARSVVIMKPFFSARGFDAVIVPRHDRPRPADNVFVTDAALSALRPERMEEEAAKLRGLPSPGGPATAGGRRIGLLVGGDTPRAHFDPARFRRFLEGLKRYLEGSGAALYITSSRRTPRWADGLLKEFFAGHPRCPLLVIANEADLNGVVPGILGLCDSVVVSGESISMVSEALGSGKPVFVFLPVEEDRLKPKVREFLGTLSRERRIRPVGEDLERTLRENGGGWEGMGGRTADAQVLREAVQKVVA